MKQKMMVLGVFGIFVSGMIIFLIRQNLDAVAAERSGESSRSDNVNIIQHLDADKIYLEPKDVLIPARSREEWNKIHDQTRACREKLKAREEAGAERSDKSQAGMVSAETVLALSKKYLRETSDPNAKPDIVLIDDYYLLRYKRYPDPFDFGEPKDDCRMAFDAWSGEFAGSGIVRRGMRATRYSRKTGAGSDPDTPEARECTNRLLDALDELYRRIGRNRTPSDAPNETMVSEIRAIEAAKEEVKAYTVTLDAGGPNAYSYEVEGRIYSQEIPPRVDLINDVYIVTFWRADKAESGPAYDSRVAIDAHTGKYIAMENIRTD